MGVCESDSLVWFRIRSIPREVRKRVAHDLRMVSRYGDAGKPLRFWKKEGAKVGIPVAYGIRLAKELGFSIKDKRSNGIRVVYRRKPVARTSNQSEFFSTLVRQTKRTECVFAVAPTGSGKTIAALNAIHALGRSALIVVPSISLAYQWRDRITEFLGLPASRIGILKGGKCDWHDKSVVVAVVHSLCKGKMGRDFHSHFGVAIWDEAHRMAAKWFSRSLMQVLAKYRIALTATPTRKDGMSKLLHAAFNEPNTKVSGNTLTALPCRAYVLHTSCTVKSPSYGTTTMKLGVLMSAVAADHKRNRLIAKMVYRGYVRGRNILILSDRIEQLKALIAMLVDKGIPRKEVGLFVSATSATEQDRIKAECRIIAATYGMMKEGQDVPRLDMGIDATPRSEGNQAIGRIRRECAGKKTPVWVTLFDHKASELLRGISSSRIKDYKSCGVEVVPVADDISRIKL